MPILKTKWLRILFLPFSLLYAVITSVRNKLYDWGVFHTVTIIDCAIISVGNITVGGTGKTPAVEFLARYFIEKGKKVVILSRGYHRTSKGTVIVSNGQNIFVRPDESGDEPYLLAKNLSVVPVVVENNRYRGGMFIKNKFNPDYIILDDAFQHRKIYRNVNIVLIDSTIGFDNRLTLPSGILREPLTGLRRADMIWLTRTDQTNSIDQLIDLLKKYNDIPILKTIHQPKSLHLLSSDEKVPLNLLEKRKVLIFAGIGNPYAFRDTILKLKVVLEGELFFIDHHKYQQTDLIKIFTRAEKTSAEWIVTTEKDAIRIFDIPEHKLPIFYLKVELKVVEGMSSLEKILKV